MKKKTKKANIFEGPWKDLSDLDLVAAVQNWCGTSYMVGGESSPQDKLMLEVTKRWIGLWK